jgi:hypothetical protein
MTVEALDALVNTVIIVCSTAVVVAFVTGAVLLARSYTGEHRSVWHAADIGHQPAHAKPSRLAVLLDGWPDLAHASALLRGAAL